MNFSPKIARATRRVGTTSLKSVISGRTTIDALPIGSSQHNRRCLPLSHVKISFCNKAYADKWFEDICSSNPDQHSVIKALIDEIERNNGGEISQVALFERYPEVARYVQGNCFRITPSNGQLLVANGKGIRHAKYSPSKSVALVWQNIKGTIYVTFDDHAPVPYHRAIWHLREISLGRSPLPKPARTRRGFMVMIEALRKRGYSRKARRLDLYRRFYR